MSGEFGEIRAHAEGIVTPGGGSAPPEAGGKDGFYEALRQAQEAVAQVDASAVWAEQRAAVEQAERDNDATLARLGAQGIGVGVPPDAIPTTLAVLQLRFYGLVEFLLGDMDQPRRIEYESMIQAKFAETFKQIEGNINRAKLLAPPTPNLDGKGFIRP